MQAQIIAAVNGLRPRATWVAGNNSRFRGWSVGRVQRLLGAVTDATDGNGSRGAAPDRQVRDAGHLTASLPEAFDARERWPGCVGPVLDQGECGDCWAVSVAEAMSDRLCISKAASSRGRRAAPSAGRPHSRHSDGSYVQLSAEDIASCDFGGENLGCLGGMPLLAWQWAARVGVVSASCMPYTIKSCTPNPECTMKHHDAMPYCTQECAVNSSLQYDSDKHRLASAYSVGSSADEIAEEVMQFGPVAVTFSVYEDFLHYRSGVYRHVAGEFMGKHAVKVIGWGHEAESGLDYWIVANSWSTSWGKEGLFRIAKGADECAIEAEVSAGRFGSVESI